jgi:hypothetical protein
MRTEAELHLTTKDMLTANGALSEDDKRILSERRKGCKNVHDLRWKLTELQGELEVVREGQEGGRQIWEKAAAEGE